MTLLNIHKSRDYLKFLEEESRIHFCRPMAKKGKCMEEHFLMTFYIFSLKCIYRFISFQPLVQGLHIQMPTGAKQRTRGTSRLGARS